MRGFLPLMLIGNGIWRLPTCKLVWIAIPPTCIQQGNITIMENQIIPGVLKCFKQSNDFDRLCCDGFPIYYKYAYSVAFDEASPVLAMSSSYRLKSGYRPGDGETAPCGEYNGIYSNDYEFIPGYGTLDEANGREGITPEYPNGTYYYMITDEFPAVPRYFVGTPSQDFKLGR